MFAPLAAKTQTKTSASSIHNRAHQRAALVAPRLGHREIEEAHMLPRSLGNQAMLQLLAQRASSPTGKEQPGDQHESLADPAADWRHPTAREAAPTVPEDASNTPEFPPDRSNSHQTRSPLSVLQLRGAIQPQLVVGQFNDPLEHEADRVAEQVLAAPAHPAVSSTLRQRQRVLEQPTGQPVAASASVEQGLASPGRPLEPVLRQDMEHRFGHDFSQVRVHTSAAAEHSAQGLNARAYTFGHNIVFDTGQFVPGTQQGRRLIAHELAHVVQDAGHAGPPVVRRQPRPDVSKFKIISRIWRVAGRDIVIIETNTGIRRAFYRRTGLGAKGVGLAPPPGGWAPFRGLEPHPGNPSQPWFSKNEYYTTVHPESELRGYGNTLNKEVAGWLDGQYITRGPEMPWQQVRQEMEDVIRRPSLAPVSPPAVAASGEIGGGRGRGGGGAKPSPGQTSSTAAKVESTATKVESTAAKVESTASKVELKTLAAEGGTAVELAGAAAKGGRLVRLGTFLLAAAMPGPLDVLFLYIGFFGSIAEAKVKLRQKYYALGFAEGLGASLLGFPRGEAMDMLVKPAGTPSIGERVAGFERVRDRATSSGSIDGFRFAVQLTSEQRTAFLQEGFGVIAKKGHTIGPNFNLDDVIELGIALQPLVEDLLELAQEQEMARRTREMVERMYEDTESMWQK